MEIISHYYFASEVDLWHWVIWLIVLGIAVTFHTYASTLKYKTVAKKRNEVNKGLEVSVNTLLQHYIMACFLYGALAVSGFMMMSDRQIPLEIARNVCEDMRQYWVPTP